MINAVALEYSKRTICAERWNGTSWSDGLSRGAEANTASTEAINISRTKILDEICDNIAEDVQPKNLVQSNSNVHTLQDTLCWFLIRVLYGLAISCAYGELGELYTASI
jgi:hypothetical protein